MRFSSLRLLQRSRAASGHVGYWKRKPDFRSSPGITRRLFKRQLAFGAQKHGANLDHPGRRRQSERHAPRISQFSLKLRIRQGKRRRQVDGACEFLVVDHPLDAANEIQLMDPRNKLAAVSSPSSEANANHPKERIEYSATIGTHRHGRTQQYLAGSWSLSLPECSFPRCGDIDAESPCVRDSVFSASKDSREFIIRSIITIGVDGCGAGLKPCSRWPGRLRYGLTDDLCGFHAGQQNFPAIGGRVAAVHTADLPG